MKPGVSPSQVKFHHCCLPACCGFLIDELNRRGTGENGPRIILAVATCCDVEVGLAITPT
ncbi:hypothetical protein HMPREF9595_00548 [Cutibacterium acnes HL005PA2]|nr:hypothetical protein HMPREF9595_00548 [Cutibacterium acnes HL005PA2]EFT33981.1 hypothetical protein HMPREF9596_01156 [Cutibacterium acnes HL005PA3]